MFEDLRNEGNQTVFEEDQPSPASAPAGKRPAKKKSARFLGMTAFQRFVIALLLFFMVCALGVAMLVLTGKLALI